MKRVRIVFLSIVILGIALRLLALQLAPSNDEINIHRMIASGKLFYPEHHAHPPLANFFFYAVGHLFGTSFVVLRLVPLLFELLSLVILYFLAYMLYGAQAARTSVKLGALSFILLANATRVHIEPVAAFFFLTCIYFYIRGQKGNNQRDMIYAGMTGGLLLLTKTVGVLVFPVLLFWSLLHSGMKDSVHSLGKVVFISLVIFLFFPLWAFLSGSPLFIESISFLFSFTGADDNLPFGSLFPFLFLFVTPFYLYFPFLALKNRTKTDNFLLSWVLITMAFYLFVIRKGDYSRYFLTGVYPLILLASGALARIPKEKWKLSLFWIATLTSILFFIFFQYSFLDTPRIIHSPSIYISSFLSGTTFFFPYSVDHGYGFGVVSPIFYALLLAHAFFLWGIIWKRTWIIPIFFGFLFGFNAFLIEEEVFSFAQPNVGRAMMSMVAYALEKELPRPYYTTDKTIMYLLNPDKYYGGYTTERSLFFYRVESKNDLDTLQKTGGTFFFLPFAAYVTEQDIQLPKCSILQEWRDLGIIVGEIITCIRKE